LGASDVAARATFAALIEVAVSAALFIFFLLFAVIEVQESDPAQASNADFVEEARAARVDVVRVEEAGLLCYRLDNGRWYTTRLEAAAPLIGVLQDSGVPLAAASVAVRACDDSLLPWWVAAAFASTAFVLPAVAGTALGATPGMVALGIRVRRRGQQVPPGLPLAILRTMTSILSVGVLFAGFLWAFRDPEARTWHDLLADTVVVRATR
jgi:uncharacterized RDD family membrane protein YckC